MDAPLAGTATRCCAGCLSYLVEGQGRVQILVHSLPLPRQRVPGRAPCSWQFIPRLSLPFPRCDRPVTLSFDLFPGRTVCPGAVEAQLPWSRPFRTAAAWYRRAAKAATIPPNCCRTVRLQSPCLPFHSLRAPDLRCTGVVRAGPLSAPPRSSSPWSRRYQLPGAACCFAQAS